MDVLNQFPDNSLLYLWELCLKCRLWL